MRISDWSSDVCSSDLIAAESGFSVTEELNASVTVTGIDKVQPTVFTMQVALAATLKAYGVLPGAVIGHSMGEVAAAVVRSEERRVGKECGRPGRSRWWRCYSKKNRKRSNKSK